jgi:class 3 adenylate cyclase
MGITKKQALRAIAAQARKHANLPFDTSALMPENVLKEYLRSPEATYKRFAEFCESLPLKRGGHPEYDFLADPANVGKTAEGNVTTFFMDLKNFTKYCCFLSRDKVYQAKYASIEAAIGVCRIHGGHLHDITGDGVMFFFGGGRANDVETARQALDAAADAMELLEKEVITEYNDNCQYPNIHPKIGVDFGPALWGAYGAPPNFEVKATAFNVDVANKMMSDRNSQEVAIGDELKNLLEVGEEEYLENGWVYNRQMTVNGEEKKISYKTWVFDWRKHLRDRNEEDKDLARIGFVTLPAQAALKGSKTTLGPAPLA